MEEKGEERREKREERREMGEERIVVQFFRYADIVQNALQVGEQVIRSTRDRGRNDKGCYPECNEGSVLLM